MDVRPPERIVTERAVIRRWTLDDAERLHAAVVVSTEHLRPWMPWIANEPQTVDQRRDLLQHWQAEWDSGESFPLGIFGTDAFSVLGSTGLHRRVGPEALEIGYWVHAEHAGLGYATEVSRALTSAALELPGIESVVIRHDRANARSGAVPRKLGYTLEREEQGLPEAPGCDGVLCWWRVTREAWRAQGANSTRPNA